MIFAFTSPIILAIMLTEIKHFKIFFRTLFFLPQMTSGIVIALMWKLMYNPTPAGFFNQMIGYLNCLPFVDIKPQAWLQDPSLAMICCIVPTVWAQWGWRVCCILPLFTPFRLIFMKLPRLTELVSVRNSGI
jgi:multiple sugar transport system permease protein